MAAQRDSINKAAIDLCDLLDEGGAITPSHLEAAKRLRKLAEAGGSYKKKYDSPEERVLNRHLNLYRNKLKSAKSDAEKKRWRDKITEQQAKIATFRGELDLDGL